MPSSCNCGGAHLRPGRLLFACGAPNCPALPSPHTLAPLAGSTVSTKHGNVQTDYILFICSGAFHSCKPSDMLAELQVRGPDGRGARGEGGLLNSC